MAKQAGFIAISLDDIYQGHQVRELLIVPWDGHPNALGHRLIADRLYKEFTNTLDLE